MARVYKTARGKNVDMDKVKLANETATAVGNMRVNARGDLLGAGKQVAAGRNQIMDRIYAVADAPSTGYSPNDPEVRAQKRAAEEDKNKALHDLANSLVDTTPPTAEPEVADTAKPARGSLASSVAKTTSVNQGPLPDPRKPKGPSRI
jgi:hypothetical protein